MAKIKITTLTDKIKDDEILSKLKSIGIKIKDKQKDGEESLPEARKSTTSGETVIEKRVASTVIRRRVQPPPAAEARKETEISFHEVAGAPAEEPVKRVAEEGRRRAEEPVVVVAKAAKPAEEGHTAEHLPLIEKIELAGIAEQAEPPESAGEPAHDRGGAACRGERRQGDDGRDGEVGDRRSR
jgi:hypothetical protein